MMLSKEELPFCPVATTVDLIGNKWKLLIMRELLTGTKRFNEIHKAIDGISQKVLTENLRKMEEDGIVDRKNYAVVPPKVEYSLSELGDSLRPIIDSMSAWGTAYIKENLK
uniref:winged helix-turn-helix transcriptional regulator n=1 Tax=Oceanobacillus sp. FSL W7-1293 TaxID=2921699 RepID=UPI00403F0762